MIYFISASLNTKIPLRYYNFWAEGQAAKEDVASLGSASGVFFNQDVINPNSYNRTNAFPITIRCSLLKEEQVRNCCPTTNGLDLEWISLSYILGVPELVSQSEQKFSQYLI